MIKKTYRFTISVVFQGVREVYHKVFPGVLTCKKKAYHKRKNLRRFMKF